MSYKIPNHLETLRLRVLDRMAALLESQTRSKIFSASVSELVRDVHQEVIGDLRDAAAGIDDPALATAMRRAADMCTRLDGSLKLLLDERSRQWYRNGDYVQGLMKEFNATLGQLSSTLIEKDLFERQSRVLEHIVLSHENISQWKEFVQEILSEFHSIFPFNFFYIAFAEEHEFSLYLYYLGEYSQEVRDAARHMLAKQMLASLGQPADAPLDIEEFVIDQGGHIGSIDEVQMIAVSVPEHAPNLAGMLGVAYVSAGKLPPQEESVIRAILAVMVMVVGSSKALSRTLSELEYYSVHDPLTGLYNRRHFNAMLEYEIGRSERHKHEFSVLLLDLDDFKDINDTYGHATGDEALRR
ncbi:MAG TPA: diguanylate cyclase, partial [Gallionella sp.]|nr:diguanylate cyclase [Gallionella sp.]